MALTPERLPRSKHVTIAMGFRFDDGVLLCADTKITSVMKADETKLKLWQFTGAGNSLEAQLVFTVAGNLRLRKSRYRGLR